MLNPRLKNLYDVILKLLRWNATARLKKIVARTRSEDLAAILALLSHKQRCDLFLLIEDEEKAGEVLAELEDSDAAEILDSLADERILSIIKQLSPDEQAALLRVLPEERARELLNALKGDEGAQVEGLLHYDEDTAGGIMVPVFFAQRENTTVGEAIQSLQSSGGDVDMPFYLYVLNDYDQLVGVVSLRQLVIKPPDTPLKDIMVTDVLSVRPETDQEEVARMVARYNILAVPVVDENNRLLGICTVDDVIDVMQDEATEDILRMAGAGEGALENMSVWGRVRARAPWLVVAMIGGFFAAFKITSFQNTLAVVPLLSGFIPLIMGMGGNVGTQSVSIAVRGLATGRIDSRSLFKMAASEMLVGSLLGVGVGLCMFLMVLYMANDVVQDLSVSAVRLGLIIALSGVVDMTIAATIGTAIPMILARLRMDPAVSTGPFVTSALDIIGLTVYFFIATNLLPADLFMNLTQ